MPLTSKFLPKSAAEKVVKIGQCLAKIWKKYNSLLFWLILYMQGVPKNDSTCFCQNFVKSSPNVIIFSTQIAMMIELCKAHSLSISHNLCQRTTV